MNMYGLKEETTHIEPSSALTRAKLYLKAVFSRTILMTFQVILIIYL